MRDRQEGGGKKEGKTAMSKALGRQRGQRGGGKPSEREAQTKKVWGKQLDKKE